MDIDIDEVAFLQKKFTEFGFFGSVYPIYEDGKVKRVKIDATLQPDLFKGLVAFLKNKQ